MFSVITLGLLTYPAMCPVTASPVTNTVQKGCLATAQPLRTLESHCAVCPPANRYVLQQGPQKLPNRWVPATVPPSLCQGCATYHWGLTELNQNTMDVALQVAAAAVVAVLALALILSRRSSYQSHVQQLQPKQKRQLVIGTWTREELAKHKTVDDLWVTIQDQDTKEWKVYDLTDYVDDHPGGMAIMCNAGGDATKGFHGPQHPSTVHELAKDYCIGNLADP